MFNDMLFNGAFIAAIAFAVLGMVSSGSMTYAESSIKEDCDKIGYFLIKDKVYKCELKK